MYGLLGNYMAKIFKTKCFAELGVGGARSTFAASPFSVHTPHDAHGAPTLLV